MRARLTFHPQAWQRDYAIDVDPEGETTWEADIPEGIRSNRDESDNIARLPEAPEWCREWSGPFYVEVEYLTAQVSP